MTGVVDTTRHRGRFFTVLQQTKRSQTAVMTIAPGADAGPEEEHDATRSLADRAGEPGDSGAPTE